MDTHADARGGNVPRFPIVEASRWVLEVLDVSSVTPNVRRLGLRVGAASPDADDGAGGSRLAHAPGQDLSLSLPGPGASAINRRYTISRFDPVASVVELEVVVHGDGPGARWGGSARPGDRIEAFGPRGKITVVDGVTTHLFVGDEASLPAIAAMLRVLGPSARAVVLADVADETEHRELTSAPGVALELRWLDRGDAPPEEPDRVLAALATVPLVPAESHAYVFGEFHVVSAARRLLADRLDGTRISPKPYWRAGRANASHGEPERDI
jgi:NADPH-dependent ferric siderophore reductase